MIFLTIIALTAVVFLSRYLFLEPSLPLKMGANAQRFLSYASPAVLTAIWGPIVFMPKGELVLSDNAPYLLAATFAILLAWKTKNVLATVLTSMGIFLVLKLWLFAS
ncbi:MULTISPECIES: AzlD domain-containing protein [Photobacterium]|uniref:Branched-chain amino acid ABC transporter n=1 Tax=Photobacterium ganghwense TaxID=320778 RepID=A0A0J1HG41_9GAMM|nr:MULTISPECIES: AzlD domain-containing protein [Photobacterium]KLV10606.1 branched-chain amino acid ABC transporter [Photobacterium ganghwense]MBV1842546.1 AzlD domain-containing protein [Photobacterium ganghwense]PSU09484.1 AzlD domain-containing protein [Photobacterium ganghwense]QSV16728.1 AzlD domain-containing protein [Photobacterium ganghwense]